MMIRCINDLGPSSEELERLGYTVFDLGLISIRDTDVHSFNLADLRIAECNCPCVFIIESQIDQAATIQPFGSQVDSPSSNKQRHNIGPARPLASQEEISITVPLADSWFPWLGLTVTPIFAPTTGNVHARAIYIRRC